MFTLIKCLLLFCSILLGLTIFFPSWIIDSICAVPASDTFGYIKYVPVFSIALVLGGVTWLIESFDSNFVKLQLTSAALSWPIYLSIPLTILILLDTADSSKPSIIIASTTAISQASSNVYVDIYGSSYDLQEKNSCLKKALFSNGESEEKAPVSNLLLNKISNSIASSAGEILEVSGIQDSNGNLKGELGVAEAKVETVVTSAISAINASGAVVVSYTERIPQLTLCRGSCPRGGTTPSYSYYDRYEEHITEISQRDDPFELTITTKSRRDKKEKFELETARINLRDISEIEVEENTEYGYFVARFLGEDAVRVTSENGDVTWQDRFDISFMGNDNFAPEKFRNLHADAYKAYVTSPHPPVSGYTPPRRAYYFATSTCLRCRPNSENSHVDYFVSDIVYVSQFDFENLEGAFYDQMRIDYVWAIGARNGRSSFGYETFEEAVRERKLTIKNRKSSTRNSDMRVHRVRIGTGYPYFVYAGDESSLLRGYYYLNSSCANCDPAENVGISFFYSDIVHASRFNTNVTSRYFETVNKKFPYGNPVGRLSNSSSTYKEAYRLRREHIANWVDDNWREEYGERITVAHMVALSSRSRE